MSTYYMGPYVNFQGQARAAMEFYQTVLGGTLDLMTLDNQGASKPAGPGITLRTRGSTRTVRRSSLRTVTQTTLPGSVTPWESPSAAATRVG